VRITGRHALGAEILASARTARYAGVPDIHSGVSSLSVTYILLGDEGMGRGR
jgi:hypothetical protein